MVCNIILKHTEEAAGDIPTMPPHTSLEDYAASNADALRRTLAVGVPMFRATAQDLENVQPPAEVAGAHNDLIAVYERLADGMDGMVTALDQPPDEAVATIEAVQTGLEDPGTVFQRFPESYRQAFRENGDCINVGYIATMP